MRRPPADRYADAQSELELYFAAGPGMWGLHAGPIEGSGISVWDERRSAAEHGRRWLAEMLGEHDRLRRVTVLVGEFRSSHPAHWNVAMVVLTPRRWPAALSAEMARGAQRGNLTGLLLSSVRLGADLEPHERLTLASRRAEGIDISATRRRELFDRLRDDCEKQYQSALAAYQSVRTTMRERWTKAKCKEMREVMR